MLGQQAALQENTTCSEILDAIEKNLTCHGSLKRTGDLVYLDIDDNFIHELVSFIQKEEFEAPPYFGDPDLVGAHITVIYPDEMETYGIDMVPELGSMMEFVPTACQIVYPSEWEEVDEVYLVIVDAPKLDTIRKQLGLPEKIYRYHITIGVKP